MSLPWIGRAPGVPYFADDTGQPWTPIGQNDALPWYDFAGVLDRRNMERVRGHLAWLRGHGVTCLRFMLEYAETGEHFFEQPAGVFNPRMGAGVGRPAAARGRTRDARAADAHGHLFSLGALGPAPLEHRQRRPLHVAHPADGVPGGARLHQGEAAVRHRALGRVGRDLCLGPVERDAPGAGRGPARLLRRLHLGRGSVAARAGGGAARPGAPANRVGVRAGAALEALAERAGVPSRSPRLRQQPFSTKKAR